MSDDDFCPRDERDDVALLAALECVEMTAPSHDLPATVGIELYTALDQARRERDEARELLRDMARRASRLRREVREEYALRYIAEQFARYAPLSAVERYRKSIGAAFFSRESVPPIPQPEEVSA